MGTLEGSALSAIGRDEVQAVLSGNRVDRAIGKHCAHPSLLTRLLFDQNGERLTPTHAVK